MRFAKPAVQDRAAMRNFYLKWRLIASTAACYAPSGLSVVILTLVVLALDNGRTSGLSGLAKGLSEML
jgi:hypothetical protein